MISRDCQHDGSKSHSWVESWDYAKSRDQKDNFVERNVVDFSIRACQALRWRITSLNHQSEGYIYEDRIFEEVVNTVLDGSGSLKYKKVDRLSSFRSWQVQHASNFCYCRPSRPYPTSNEMGPIMRSDH
jgi:hypothetical protein